MAILGTQSLTGLYPGTSLDNGANNQRAVVLASFVPATPGYVTAIGVHVRRSGGGTPNVQMAVWAVDGAGAPAALLAATPKANVPSGAGGSAVEVAVTTPARLDAGVPYAVGLLLLGANAEVSAVPGGAAVTQHRRTMGGGTTPRNPFAPTSTSSEPPLLVWAQFTPDSAPTLTATSPAAGAATVAVPTFVGAFGDADIALGDGLSGYTAQVRAQATGAPVWDATFSASAGERAAKAPSRLYAGPGLAADGTVYEWRMQARDDSGVASAWTAWRAFTVNPLGTVDTAAASSPAAKVDTDPALTDWGGHWSHPAHLSTNAVQARVLTASGAVVRTGAVVAQTVSGAGAGADFTVGHAAAGIGSLPGGAYLYQAQGRATDGQWSPWSDAKAFVVNSAPTTPSNVQPPSGSVSTSRPVLSAAALDPDAEDVSDLTLSVVLTRPDASVTTVTVPNAAWNPATGRFSYQTTPTDVNQYGAYSFTAQAVDGAGPFNGASAVTAPQTFTWANGPTVTVSAPAAGATITTSVPSVNFAASAGTFGSWQVEVRRRNAAAAFTSTGKVAVGSLVSSFSAPLAAGLLVNGGSYDLRVTVWDGSNAKWQSLWQPFDVAYPAATALNNVAAGTARHRRESSDTSVVVTWDETNYPSDQFAGYVVRRRGQGEDISAATVLRVLTAPGQARFVDYHAPADAGLTYSVSQLWRSGADTQESPPVDVDATLPLQYATLVSVGDPESTRSQFRWLMDDTYALAFERPEQGVQTWGSNGKETLVSTPATYGKQTFDLTVTVVGDDRGTMLDHWADLVALATRGRECCFRSAEGERAFVRVSAFRGQRKGAWRVARTATVTLVEIDFQERQTI